MRRDVKSQQVLTLHLGRLALAQAASSSCMLLGMALAPLAAVDLTGRIALAATPMTVTLVSSAVLAGTLAPVLRRTGYRRIVMVGAVGGVAGGALCALALTISNFGLLLVGSGLLGAQKSLAGFLRFAALETVDSNKQGKALALLFAAAVIAILVAASALPHLDVNFLTDLQRGYWMLSALALAALLTVLKIDEPIRRTLPQSPRVASRPSLHRHRTVAISALGQIFMAVGMVLMPMMAGHSANGHLPTLAEIAQMAQWHMLGMLAPAAIAATLVDRYGTNIISRSAVATMAIAGLATTLGGAQPSWIYLCSFVFGAGAKILLVTASCRLTSTCTGPNLARWQVIMETVNATVMAITALAGSWILSHLAPADEYLSIVGVLLVVLLASLPPAYGYSVQSAQSRKMTST